MRVLIIKNDRNTFEAYYNREIKKHKVELRTNIEMLPFLYGKLSIRKSDLIKGIFDLLNGKFAKKISEFDVIVVFSTKAIIPVIYSLFNRNARVIYWQWNIASAEYAKKVNRVKRRCEIWTFDKKDAEKYKWKLNNQFYCPKEGIVETKLDKKIRNAIFLGVDKGRYADLLQIEKKLTSYKVKTNFYLLSDNTTNAFDKNSDIQILDKSMDYEKYLELVKNNELLIEVVQKNQSGITLRALEAVFYNKKLITNNKEIKNEVFYNSNNIFVLGDDSWDTFEKFMESAVQPVPIHVLSEYTVEKWIANFEKNQ